jgi:hypothetical protein
MTAMDAFQEITHGGGNDFADVVRVLDAQGPWCLIGGLAVNAYVDPVYTLDADIVVVSEQLAAIRSSLELLGFRMEQFPHSLNARRGASDLNIQFTTDPRYQDFVAQTERRSVLGIEVPVASLDNLVRGKVWAWRDANRRATKRKKDELDLLRIAETHPRMRGMIPAEITAQL